MAKKIIASEKILPHLPKLEDEDRTWSKEDYSSIMIEDYSLVKTAKYQNELVDGEYKIKKNKRQIKILMMSPILLKIPKPII